MRIGAAALIALMAAKAPTSKFVSTVEAETYPSVAAPEKSPDFHWDFSAKRDYRFRYEQTSESAFTGMGDGGETKQSVSTTADVVIRSLGDGTAKFVMENGRVTGSFATGGAGDKAHEMSQEVPGTVVPGLREDGTFSGAAAAAQPSLSLLFPLPTRPLAVGESVDVPIELPFHASGSLIPVKGTNHITNTGFAMLGKRHCARLESVLDVHRLDVPEEIAGKYEYSTIGKSVFFFDVQERRFVRGVVAVLTTMSVDTPAPKIQMEGEKAAEPKRITMSIRSDDLIKVSLAE